MKCSSLWDVAAEDVVNNHGLDVEGAGETVKGDCCSD